MTSILATGKIVIMLNGVPGNCINCKTGFGRGIRSPLTSSSSLQMYYNASSNKLGVPVSSTTPSTPRSPVPYCSMRMIPLFFSRVSLLRSSI